MKTSGMLILTDSTPGQGGVVWLEERLCMHLGQ